MTRRRSLLHSTRDIPRGPGQRPSTPRDVGHSAFGAGDVRLLHDQNCGDSQSSRRARCHATRKACCSHQTSSRRTGKAALRRSRGAAFDRRRSATVSITGSRITIQIANSDRLKLRSSIPTSPLFPSPRAEPHPPRTRLRPHLRIPILSRCARLGHRRPIPRPPVYPLRSSPREQTGR